MEEVSNENKAYIEEFQFWKDYKMVHVKQKYLFFLIVLS